MGIFIQIKVEDLVAGEMDQTTIILVAGWMKFATMIKH